MGSLDQKAEHLDQAIAQAMGGEAPAVNPAGVEAPLIIPIHDSNELPQDCRGSEGNGPERWTHPTKLAAEATANELYCHAQYLEWRAGLLNGEAAALRSIAATR
jgi:hypothetical protein